MPAKKKTLVRGAGGKMFLLSENETPQELTPEQKTKVNDIITKAEDKLSTEIETTIPALGSGVHLAITDVFP
jgi:hypothetical protein